MDGIWLGNEVAPTVQASDEKGHGDDKRKDERNAEPIHDKQHQQTGGMALISAENAST